MALRNLLVHLDGTDAAQSRADVALSFAEAHGAHLTALVPTATPIMPGYIAGALPPELIEQQEQHALERAQAVVAVFDKAAASRNVSADTRIASCDDLQVARVVSLHARYSDMVFLGQFSPDEPAPGGSVLIEDVVLGSGRPALIVPYIGAKRAPGGRVMIAWDGGREAARAVQDALPILERAEAVIIQVVDAGQHPWAHGEEPGADIALHLSRHGVRAEVHRSEGSGLTVGEEVLSRLADEDCDLLVMGAYGHSRLREVVLGGATQTMLEEMTVPVFMSH